MQRVLNIETIKHIGKEIKVQGWINSRRDHGKIVFFDLRDFSGILQVVLNPEIAKGVGLEYVVEIEGKIQKRPAKMINSEIETGGLELNAKSIKILAKSEVLPFDIHDLKATLPTLLDYRPITLRNEKVRAIFKIREGVITSFRNTLKNLGFYEFEAPTIVPANAEGGAAVFHIDYYDKDAYLAQSPQLYKQILIGALERVFTVTNILRAEPSITTRHLSESTSLDVEMGFIESWQELMSLCETIIKNIVLDIQKNYKNELNILKIQIPQIGEKIPIIKMREAQEIIFERTKRDNRQEPDLEPGDEKEICNFAKEKYNSDFIFITHYPAGKRPFYTYPDPQNEKYTLSFDVLFKGLEIASGGQRINDYEKLIENIRKWGNDPKDFDFYLQAFKYGMPPEGGFAFGAERIVKQFLNLENLREASFFPRDMERIDQRLSFSQQKNKIKGRKIQKKEKINNV